MKLSRSLLAITLLASATLAGCANAPTTTPTASNRGASMRDTQFCIINNTSMNVRVLWSGYPDYRSMPPGGQNCNTGLAYKTADIEARLEYEPVSYPGSWLSWELEASNVSTQAPYSYVWYVAQGKKYGMTIEDSVGVKASMQMDWLRADIVRAPDSADHIEFVLTLTNGKPGDNHAVEINTDRTW